MKFLCVPCDSPMKLQTIGPPDGGSLSVVYACPECGYEMAMLTNPYETQLVQSLGVRIGPESGAAASSGLGGHSAADQETGTGVSASGGRCPFSAMMPAMGGMVDGAAAAAGRPSAGAETPDAEAGESIPVRWTSGAEARLGNMPAFVRPMARTGIERFARDRGALEVNEQVLDAAREFFGM